MLVNWIKKTLEFVGIALFILCFLIGLVILGYLVYLWVGILKTLSFLELAISIGLFPITIPVAPIYLGFDGDWWPAIYILLGFLILIISISICHGFWNSAFFAYWCIEERYAEGGEENFSKMEEKEVDDNKSFREHHDYDRECWMN